MKKIMTAINNPKLNEELKKERNFQIIGKDIQYKEAILDVLEKNNDIDLIIISEKILGEIKVERLIQKIKIIYILEKENNEIEKILIKNNIFDIYYNNKINIEELIKIINKKEINMEEEIFKLRKIIEEKYNSDSNKENKNIKIYLNKKMKNIKNKENKKYNKITKIPTKIITFSGNYKSGKSTISLIITQYLSQKNYKTIIIDGDFEKQDLKTIIKKEVNRNDKKISINKKRNNRKIRLTNKNDKKLINKKNNIYFYKIKKEIKNFIVKLNNNLFFYYGFKNLLENKRTKKEKKVKKIIKYFFEILKQNYDFIIIDLSKNNYEKINKYVLLKSYINFICLEGNILGIKECKKLLNKYVNDWEINKKSIYVIECKKNYLSMNKNLIAKSLFIKNKIFEIREGDFYRIFFYYYFKKKLIFKNKKIKKEIDKIITKII